MMPCRPAPLTCLGTRSAVFVHSQMLRGVCEWSFSFRFRCTFIAFVDCGLWAASTRPMLLETVGHEYAAYAVSSTRLYMFMVG